MLNIKILDKDIEKLERVLDKCPDFYFCPGKIEKSSIIVISEKMSAKELSGIVK